jgi:archaellum component FlaF (FlaF/FlaG flagellin family)
MAAKPKSRSSRIVLMIVVAIVAIVIIAIVLFSGVYVPMGTSKVSIKEASLSWEYSNLDKSYHVSHGNVTLTNNGEEQLFNLDILVEGNWPVEYEQEKVFWIDVGAGLMPGETRTISDNNWNNLVMSGACTKQLGTYSVTFRVVKFRYNAYPLGGYEVSEVYGERTTTTHVP